MQSCLNQKEINSLNRYRRAKLTIFLNLKRLQRDNEVFCFVGFLLGGGFFGWFFFFFLRAMSGPTLTDSLVVFTFCFPHFNLPQPSHSLVFLGRGFDFLNFNYFNFNFNFFFCSHSTGVIVQMLVIVAN